MAGDPQRAQGCVARRSEGAVQRGDALLVVARGRHGWRSPGSPSALTLTRRGGRRTVKRLPCPGALSMRELRLVAQKHVLDDGEPQTGAAGRARAAAVDAVEALGQARNVFGGDADAGVGDGELAAFRAHPPVERHATAVGRIAHRIADQVAEGADQLVPAAESRSPARGY